MQVMKMRGLDRDGSLSEDDGDARPNSHEAENRTGNRADTWHDLTVG